MIRKYLFFGLMIMLAATVVWMILQTRRQEKLLAAQAIETVRSVTPSATRVFAPPDLEVLSSSMQVAPSGGAAPASGQTTVSVAHHFEIRNSGTTPYGDLLLSITYQGSAGNEVYQKDCLVAGSRISPAQTLTLKDIVVEGVPGEAVGCKARVVYAEVDRAAQGGNSSPK